MQTITKQTSLGTAIITFANATATATVAGKFKGTDGMVHRITPRGEIVAGICGIGLTASEADFAEAALKACKIVPTASRGPRVLTAQQRADRDDGVRTL